MSDGAYYRQQIEQAITTVFTCRSIIRFNTVLNEEQKQELLADIDIALQFIQSRLVAHTLNENTLSYSTATNERFQTNAEDFLEGSIKSQGKEQDQQILQALYTLYHVYLGSTQTQSNNAVLNTFITRFNEIMYIIRGIQESKNYFTSSYPTAIDESLQRIKSYIAELYYIFMEFIRTISIILQINDIHVDTDELPPTQKQPAMQDQQKTMPGQQTLMINEITRLQTIYETHQRLNSIKGGIANRVSDTTALIAYLEESFGRELKKHNNLTARLKMIPLLLNDLAALLSEYEDVIGSLLKERE
ncbi:MAG TPA: hypothetical protein VGN34_00425 [Ktedonobacteraceae bacterium]